AWPRRGRTPPPRGRRPPASRWKSRSAPAPAPAPRPRRSAGPTGSAAGWARGDRWRSLGGVPFENDRIERIDARSKALGHKGCGLLLDDERGAFDRAARSKVAAAVELDLFKGKLGGREEGACARFLGRPILGLGRAGGQRRLDRGQAQGPI